MLHAILNSCVLLVPSGTDEARSTFGLYAQRRKRQLRENVDGRSSPIKRPCNSRGACAAENTRPASKLAGLV